MTSATLTRTVPTVGRIVRHSGIAGQLAYSTTVAYPGEDATVVTFTSSTYGGPVVMVTPSLPRGIFVTDPDRFGSFGPEWVRRFFAPQTVPMSAEDVARMTKNGGTVDVVGYDGITRTVRGVRRVDRHPPLHRWTFRHVPPRLRPRRRPMTGVRVYDPAKGSRVYRHCDPVTGRILPEPSETSTTHRQENAR
jgi:hypothetical protein